MLHCCAWNLLDLQVFGSALCVYSWHWLQISLMIFDLAENVSAKGACESRQDSVILLMVQKSCTSWYCKYFLFSAFHACQVVQDFWTVHRITCINQGFCQKRRFFSTNRYPRSPKKNLFFGKDGKLPWRHGINVGSKRSVFPCIFCSQVTVIFGESKDFRTQLRQWKNT